jgi:CheY-like chemotaxis protein
MASINQYMEPRILIIEDDPIQQKLYRVLCTRYGYELSMFSSCLEACDYLRAAAAMPSLILLDWFLKKEIGLECIDEVRQICSDRNVRVPIVAVTANAFDSDRRKCLDAGVDDYLAKPFTLVEFTGVVDRWTTVAEASGVA